MAKGKYQRIAMACQGGGALGAYHIGALKAMEEKGYSPDMVAGISIGAFSAAIIAGNTPQDRVRKLEEFWDAISWPESPFFLGGNEKIRKIHNNLSALQSLTMGQPNFFTPRFPCPELSRKGTIEATSYYDTAKLRDTLLKFVDFDVLNSKTLGARLLLGASRVKDGELVFFDSDKMKIGPEHVMASGAMPPGFPGIVIDGDLYWDGACTSNTPIESIFVAEAKVPTLCFMIDLYAPNGKEPETIDEVKMKKRELTFSSRTAHHIGHVQSRHNLAKALNHLLMSVPNKNKNDPIIQEIMGMATDVDFDVVHIAYNKPDYENANCRYEFSKTSIRERAQQGYEDMKAAIEHESWLMQRPSHVGSAIHRYVGGKYKGSS